MEFGIQKCAMLKIVRGKMVECEGISLPNGEKIGSLEKGQDYRYLGVLQCDTIKNKEMKELLRNEYFRRVRKMLKSRLNSGIVIQANKLQGSVSHQVLGVYSRLDQERITGNG